MKYNYSRHLRGHKYLEAELMLGYDKHWDHRPFNFSLSYTTKGDHHGLRFNVELLSVFEVDIQVYDNRHWNWSEDRYMEFGEEAEEHWGDKINFSDEILEEMLDPDHPRELGSNIDRSMMWTRIVKHTNLNRRFVHNMSDEDMIKTYKKIKHHYD